MKKLKFFFFLACSFSVLSCMGQFKFSPLGGYAFSLRIDSSQFFILGGQPNKTEKTKFATENRPQEFSSYFGEVTLWSNAYIFNDSTEKLVKIFNLPLIGVYPVINTMQTLMYDNYYYQRSISSGIAKDVLVFAVKTDSYNNDGLIDSDDPVYLFVSKKDGTGAKQITPNGMNVTNWRLNKGGAGILLTIQNDKNEDKKFLEDEELYQINLDPNISKIKSTAVLPQ
ncbi:MAG TPA: hypothetical protein PKC62_10970 [Ferruginibacter sp.]|nr:hypothetical protein [Bacteroidota bacterium]MBS1926885.1 hypothetical protein [Bacteroidota bacterium]MCC6692925.1 hypothetical protein [Chitinophagaceae bacterium]HMT97198.1 hypothetical protein [Ferruginibacter sp.]